MWEKLKRWIISVMTVAPFTGSIIWQSFDWIRDGRPGPWWEIFTSSEVLFGIVGSTVVFISTLIYYVQHLGALKQLPELEKKLDKVESTGIEAIQTATGFIERAFGLQVMTDLRDRHSEAALEALQALGFNLRNWENHVTTKQNGKIVLVDDDKKIAVWLRYMRTYYFEEAFDVRRKELVTNGRNFCFILLATLQALLEQLNGNEKLHYYAVTPVHPKDWYNWPHGYCKPRAYFEEDFVGLFYRVLRETLKSPEVNGKLSSCNPIFVPNPALKSPEVNGKLIHGRFILTSKGVLKDDQPFGWALDDYRTMSEQLRKTWMLPIAVPISKLERANCPVLKAFGIYYGWLNGLQRFPGRGGDRLVIPLFCSSWEWTVVQQWFEDMSLRMPPTISVSGWIQEQQGMVAEAWEVLRNANAGDGKELISLAKEFHIELLQDSALDNIAPPQGCSRCATVYKEIRESCIQLRDGKLINIPDFVQKVHHYNVLLSEHDERDKQEKLKLLLLSVLRLRDCQLMSNPPNPWPKLGEVFGKTSHLPQNECWLVGLDGPAQSDWYQSGVKPEFSFFGISKNNESPQWKLVIATDLDYPFELAKIRIIEPGDPEWEAYEVKINQLCQRRDFTFRKLSEVMQ
jgi:hypothetical protein